MFHDEAFEDDWGRSPEDFADFADDGWGEDGVLGDAVAFGENLAGDDFADEDFGATLHPDDDWEQLDFAGELDRLRSEAGDDFEDYDSTSKMVDYWEDEFAVSDEPDSDYNWYIEERAEHWEERDTIFDREFPEDDEAEWAAMMRVQDDLTEGDPDWRGELDSAWDRDDLETTEAGRRLIDEMDRHVDEHGEDDPGVYSDEEMDMGYHMGRPGVGDPREDDWLDEHPEYDDREGGLADEMTVDEDLIAMKEELLELELENAQNAQEQQDSDTKLPGDSEDRKADDEDEQTGEGPDDNWRPPWMR